MPLFLPLLCTYCLCVGSCFPDVSASEVVCLNATSRVDASNGPSHVNVHYGPYHLHVLPGPSPLISSLVHFPERLLSSISVNVFHGASYFKIFTAGPFPSVRSLVHFRERVHWSSSGNVFTGQSHLISSLVHLS